MKACPQCNLRYPQEAIYCFLDGAELSALRDPLIGTTIAGRYLVEGVIGEGGMAIVYRAHHKLVDRPCAVKVMNPALATDPTVRERFRREAKSAQAIAHPNVIEIFDQGETADGTPYIVMELLDGRSLAEVVATGFIPPSRGVPLMIQIARGIARAHDLGVVHRDLKPENIFVCQRLDGTDLVKLLDFGIARSRSDTRLTNAGELFGTPQYLAPERITGGETGPSVDLYALGVIFFEMTTGRLPFEGADPTAFLIKHMKERPPAPRSLDPRIPEKLEALILQLLEKEPKVRPVDAHRIEHDLVALARTLPNTTIPPEPEVEPASSRVPARTLPALVVELWTSRLAVFQRMLARVDGGARPGDLETVLAEIAKLVREIAEVRTAAALEQRKLEDVDARGRDGRQRFGFAVDALGLDASRARDELRAARAGLDELAQKSRGAADAYTETQRAVIVWEGRSGQQEPYAQLAQAYRRSADAVDAWLGARKAERTAQDAIEGRERTVSDLDYQIAQLRAALANHEQGFDRDREAAQRRVAELNARAERIEAQLIKLATRFCEPLRARPELGQLFQQLESEAAANG
jgi:serine/threonine-protein kinase